MVNLAVYLKIFSEHLDAILGKTLLLEIPNFCLRASTANSWITACISKELSFASSNLRFQHS